MEFARLSTCMLQSHSGLVCAGGKIEWSGDWSDSSLLWTSDLKDELGFTAKDDGTFWMCLVDFASRFEVGCP